MPLSKTVQRWQREWACPSNRFPRPWVSQQPVAQYWQKLFIRIKPYLPQLEQTLSPWATLHLSHVSRSKYRKIHGIAVDRCICSSELPDNPNQIKVKSSITKVSFFLVELTGCPVGPSLLCVVVFLPKKIKTRYYYVWFYFLCLALSPALSQLSGLPKLTQQMLLAAGISSLQHQHQQQQQQQLLSQQILAHQVMQVSRTASYSRTVPNFL